MKKMIILAVLMVAGLFITNSGTTLLNAQTGTSTISGDVQEYWNNYDMMCCENGGMPCVVVTRPR